MKYVLAIPPSPWLISDTDLPMLGMLYISASLKAQGCDVTVCDLTGSKKCELPDGDIYFITGTSPQFPYVKKICEHIKKKGRKIIIIGGPHASAMPVLTQEETGCTFVYQGQWPIDDVIPDRHAIDFEKYIKSDTFSYLMGDVREATMMTSFGCPNNCKFCASKCVFPKLTFRKHRLLEEEVQQLAHIFNIKLLEFVDDSLMIKESHLYYVCSLVKKYSLSWHCLGRADQCDEDHLGVMKESGCLQICIGFESGSQGMLNNMNKKADIGAYMMATKNCHNNGIMVKGQLIVGYPGESDKTVDDTCRFIERNKADKWALHFFQPLPGSVAWKEMGSPTDFGSLQTIGKPGVYPTEDKKLIGWYEKIKGVIGQRSIEV